MSGGEVFQNRRKYIHVGLAAPSMAQKFWKISPPLTAATTILPRPERLKPLPLGLAPPFLHLLKRGLTCNQAVMDQPLFHITKPAFELGVGFYH